MIVTDPEIVGPWVREGVGDKWVPGSASAIGMISDGVLKAGVLYEGFNKVNVFCHIRADAPLTKNFLGMIFQYPFLQLGVKRITGLVAACNEKAVNLDLRLGFEIEATLKDAHPIGDILVLSMKKENCRFLDTKFGDLFVKYR